MKTSTVVFGGFFITDNGERIQIPVLENPGIREINHFFSVSNFEKKAGVLVFRIIPEPKFGHTELTVYFEKGYYSGNTIEIWGDFYPIEHISKNISTIQNIISEFIRQKQTPAPII
ncbi:DUF6911 family protein [Neisseria polysaccharea]|uniref:DUF6911 family protein n=1 Tax=Neisseria polysaccharea TaxID=489 RepID=UPI000E1DEDDB|nr:hypothetical protein [Neisseria polysaccharea]